MMQNQKSNVGFTLVEILVFLAVVTILTTLLLSILFSFYKSRRTARELSTLQDAITYIFNDLTMEIHWSDRYLGLPGVVVDQLVLQKNSLDEDPVQIFYRIDGRGQLLKNDQPLSLPNVVVTNFTVLNRAGMDELPCLEIQLGVIYKESSPLIAAEQKSTISMRKKGIKPSDE